MQKLMCSLAIVAAASACRAKEITPAEPPLASVLPRVPLPPGGIPLTKESGSDASQIVVVTNAMPDSVTTYYRDLLSAAPYRLVSETKTGSTTAFYAEQDGPSLWITVEPNGTEGSQVTIAGGRVDSTKVDSSKRKRGGG